MLLLYRLAVCGCSCYFDLLQYVLAVHALNVLAAKFSEAKYIFKKMSSLKLFCV